MTRLVAKGFIQEYGIHNEETFAPVACLSTVRTFIALFAIRKWQLFQMNVKNAFLNVDLGEELYKQPPFGYDHPPGKVCKLCKALYGLKQAPRAWFSKFITPMTTVGFQSSSYNYALFLHKPDSGTTVLLLYVDDMIITGDDLVSIRELKIFLKPFEMKDLGTLSYLLGLEVFSSSSGGYYLSQAKYAFELLIQAGLTDNKTTYTPGLRDNKTANIAIEPNANNRATDRELLKDATLYWQLIGCLVYLTVTCLDISYAVHVVSQFMASPRSTHYAVVLHIL